MAGFSVPNQVFGMTRSTSGLHAGLSYSYCLRAAACDQISSGLLSSPVSGLLGLAWKTIAASGSMPFWQALAMGGDWDNPVMSFTLTRYVCLRHQSPGSPSHAQLGHAFTRFVNIVGASSEEPGGIFTMGYLNTSLYTGSIEYTSLVNSGTYWLIPLTSTSPLRRHRHLKMLIL
jgi:cathepsin D